MKVAFYTLGCKVNQYETQGLREAFLRAGYTVADEREPADVYVVNTCTVTGMSDRKSRQYIRRTKRLNPQSVTVVTGCYAQTGARQVAAIPGVDIVAGTNEKANILRYVEEYLAARRTVSETASKAQDEAAPVCHIRPYEELDQYEEMGIITSMESRTRAFIKIQEGCNRFCSYCVIPYARGTLRSRNKAEIVAEARSLLTKGFKELVLTGINTALYGMEPDFLTEEGEPRGVESIVKAISALPGEFRIRLSSLEPTVVNAEYVLRLLQYEKLCHHLHLSLQSGSDPVLCAMNRHYTAAEYEKIVAELRKIDPGYGISTDLIAGFPGETEDDHRQTLAVISRSMFCKVHAFPYSKRKGTKAAALPEQISPEIKARRSAELAAAGELAADAFFRSCAGQIRTVLFEEKDEKTGLWRGHADNFVQVYCHSENDLENQFVQVQLCEPLAEGIRGELCGR